MRRLTPAQNPDRNRQLGEKPGKLNHGSTGVPNVTVSGLTEFQDGSAAGAICGYPPAIMPISFSLSSLMSISFAVEMNLAE
ncbi:MAG: hypothetical protein OXH27_00110 [Gammaproteobacteria bacterium]|nr:hypothetical protein [Gammaproteobacteria bacterium]